MDYDAARSKLRKVTDKPGEDGIKLPKACSLTTYRCLCRCRYLPLSIQTQQEHDEAKEIFETINQQLLTDLPRLLDLRIPYFDPSFEAMIRMQIKFAEEGYEKLGAVQR